MQPTHPTVSAAKLAKVLNKRSIPKIGEIIMKILIRNQGHKKWNLVETSGYAAETELQKLLAESPSLISIDEIRLGSPPLVAAVREVGLPGSGFTDLLAFNVRGDIAIIECKLAANVEIKRKVIAQVLEYGAYLWTLTYDKLNALIFQRTNQNLADLVGSAAGDSLWDEEGFRAGVEENLSNGAFILVIAVDEMNDELERTLRFINTCGNPAFNFTVLEVRRFQRDQTEILVPNLHGTVNMTQSGKGRLSRKQWTEAEFFAKTEVDLPSYLHNLIKDIYQWSKIRADRVWFGVGGEKGSYTFHYLLNGKALSIFSIYTNGTMIINYGWLQNVASHDLLVEFHQTLTHIPDFSHIPADFTRWPSVKISDVFLGKSEHLDKFKNLVEEFGTKIKKSSR
jgi:hypothetical protein